MKKQIKQRKYWLLFLLTLSLLFVSFINRYVFSSVLGLFSAALPWALFAFFCFKTNIKMTPKAILNRFYRLEAFKIGLTCLMLSLVFQWPNLKPASFFLGFIGMLCLSVLFSLRHLFSMRRAA